MTRFINAFLLDDQGATAIEYGLIAALVSVAASVSLLAVGSSLRGILDLVSTSVTNAVTPSP
jgi:pilus assembly protein Flp/PilA